MKLVLAEPIIQDKKLLNDFVAALTDKGFEVVVHSSIPADEAELASRIADAEVVVISNHPLSAEVMKQAPKLKLVAVAFTGFDHVDLDYCRSNAITVTNAPGYSSIAVTEQTLLMILMLLRRGLDMNRAAENLETRQGFLGTEIANKTIGIVGFGQIGRRLAQILTVLGAQVVVASRSDKAAEFGFEVLSLPQLLQQSDIVSLHVPLTAETKHLISAAELAMMKKDAFLVNTSRGAVVDNEALALALRAGTIAGAAIDVFEYEPPLKSDYPLLNAPNVFLLPHTAYATSEAMERRLDIVLKNIVLWLNKTPVNIVA